MAILFPLILPAAHSAAPCNLDVFYGTIASILSGAVFGDHCSPISDTTILSAIACRCDLGAHVKTQAPYALLCGLIGILFGELPTGYGAYSTGVGLCLSLLAVMISAYFLSVPVESKKTGKRVGCIFGLVCSLLSPVVDYVSLAIDWLSEKLHVK
jgi:Na+/H+ antiporter NhaC